MKLTWLDANSWLIEANDLRILLDPWLVGDLVFGNLPWLIRGSRAQPIDIPQNIDLIVLSQGLADHAHPETLKTLDKSIPIVASADGADVATGLGYQSVTAVGHGDTFSYKSLHLQTFAGAVVGPGKRENGYVLSFSPSGSTASSARATRLYYEPHGYPDRARLENFGPVDVVITPIADITLMGLAPVVRGSNIALQVAEMLQPQVMLPTAEAGRVTYDGVLAAAIKTTSGAAELRSQLESMGNGTQIIQPIAGEVIELNLRYLQKTAP
ncbi:MAG: MBL fold metallo-hydrolase [Phormidesmis sp. RL_2_1]|nr:MBL fold metallo-hydrolase [Phormidesmis sp. RL_2_1]